MKRTVKQAPGGLCPGRLASTDTEAACCLAISNTMGKPSPEPSIPVPKAR